MYFFDQQERAKRKSVVLVVLYILAVGISIGLVYLVALWTTILLGNLYNVIRAYYDIDGTFVPLANPGLWNAWIFAIVAVLGLAVMVGATLRRLRFMGSGAETVALLMGGTLVDPRAHDTGHKRLLNIVEEMAIASGLPIPLVYVLRRESGINAFSSGFSHDEAAIAVTQGALDMLAREELQAVVAHEFCHILYGDTQLKTLMAGLLHGIMMPWHFLRVSLMGIIRGHSAVPHPLALGIVIVTSVVSVPLIVVTQIGAIMAAWIKRHVSVEREYLADAAAVQFTRNGMALADAFKKIGGYIAGSRVLTPEHDYASHLFFANPLGSGMLSWAWLRVHPPLEKRIRRIDPRFDGVYARVASKPVLLSEDPLAPVPGVAPAKTSEDSFAFLDADEVPDRNNLDAASRLLGGLQHQMEIYAREPQLAPAIVYAFLLSHDTTVRQQQRNMLLSRIPSETLDTLDMLSVDIVDTKCDSFLAAIKLAARSLRSLPTGDQVQLIQNVEALIAVDGKVRFLEAAIRQAVRQEISPSVKKQQGGGQRKMPTSEFQTTCRELLSCLAYWGTYDIAEEEDAYKAGMRVVLRSSGALPGILAASECTQSLFTAALEKFAPMPAFQRNTVMEACRACIASNNITTDDDIRLFRNIAAALKCPMPKLP